MPSFPLTMPTTPAPRAATLRQIHAVGSVRSPWTTETQTARHVGGAWAIDIALPPMEYAQSKLWQSFFAKLEGPYGTFEYGLPDWANSGSHGSGVVGAGNSARSYSLVCKSFDNSEQVLDEGEVIQVGANLHMVTEDATTDGSGNVTLSVWPPIRTAYAEDTSIDYATPVGTWRLVAATIPMDISTALHYGFSFSALEAL